VCVLARDAVEEMRLATVAQPLALRPAVEAVLEGERPGRVRLELSYLTGGLSWSAEHTLVRRSETTAAWSATVQVRNSTGRDFVDADLRLVAGEPQRGGRGPAPRAVAMMAARAEDAVAEKSVLQEEGFAEYHLYRLPQPATLRDREVQSLVMLEARDVRVAPRYLYRDGDAQGVRAQLELRNERAAGLGVPLPGGRVRVYEPDAAGALQFAGETTIRHTAVDESLTLDVGRAFDLAAERRVTADRRLSDRERERSVEIELRNHKGAAVTVLVEESVPADTEVLRSTVPVVRKDAGTLSFEVPVPAGERAVLSYAARLRW